MSNIPSDERMVELESLALALGRKVRPMLEVTILNNGGQLLQSLWLATAISQEEYIQLSSGYTGCNFDTDYLYLAYLRGVYGGLPDE